MLQADAVAIGLQFMDVLRQYCSKLEFAGSIRRNKPDVGDIEIVAQPLNEDEYYLMQEKLTVLVDAQTIKLDRKSKNGAKAPFGPKYYRLTYRDAPLDLFVVLPPADWGIIFTIRTGSADFSKWIVTEAIHRGFKVDQGQLFKVDPLTGERRYIPCPTEESFFSALGLEWLEPEKREKISRDN